MWPYNAKEYIQLIVPFVDIVLQYSPRREGHRRERERRVYETDSTSLRDEFAEFTTFRQRVYETTFRLFDNEFTSFRQRVLNSVRRSSNDEFPNYKMLS